MLGDCDGLDTIGVSWFMSHSIGTSALGDMENVIVVRCIGVRSLCCVDMCDITCNPNLSQYNRVYEYD